MKCNGLWPIHRKSRKYAGKHTFPLERKRHIPAVWGNPWGNPGQENEANRRTHIQLVRLAIDEKHTTISSNFRQLCTAMAEGKSFIARNIGSRKRSLNRKVYREKVVQKLAFLNEFLKTISSEKYSV